MKTLQTLPRHPRPVGLDWRRGEAAAVRPPVKDMTMETIGILGITFIITLMLVVVAFAYKALPILPEKR